MIRVGVIGTGRMGTDHVRRLAHEVAGATVTGVYDVAADRAKEVAASAGATAHDSAVALVEADDVDAVLVASPGDLHVEQVLACLAAAKPVLCEKPLANSSAECLDVVRAEAALGRRLVQVGFMRRYDAGYAAAREAIVRGEIGQPLVAHFVHRNIAPLPAWSSRLTITDSLIHEIDCARFLFGEEITAATVVSSRPSPGAPDGVRDPLLVLLELAGGMVADCEVFVASGYGYEVRGEVVGSRGAVLFDHVGPGAAVRNAALVRTTPVDFLERFAAAYLAELQAWIDELTRTAGSGGDRVSGPSAWDGYAGAVAAETCVASLDSGSREQAVLVERPPFYG